MSITHAFLSREGANLFHPYLTSAQAIRLIDTLVLAESGFNASLDKAGVTIVQGKTMRFHVTGLGSFTHSTYDNSYRIGLRLIREAGLFPALAIRLASAGYNPSGHWDDPAHDGGQVIALIGQLQAILDVISRYFTVFKGSVTAKESAQRGVGIGVRDALSRTHPAAHIQVLATWLHVNGLGSLSYTSSSHAKRIAQDAAKFLSGDPASSNLDPRLAAQHVFKIGNYEVLSQDPDIMRPDDRSRAFDAYFPSLMQAWTDVERATGHRWKCTSYLRRSYTHQFGLSMDIAPDISEASYSAYAVHNNSDPVLHKRERLLRQLQSMASYPRSYYPVGLFVENDHIHMQVFPSDTYPHPSYSVMKWGTVKPCYPDSATRMRLPLITT